MEKNAGYLHWYGLGNAIGTNGSYIISRKRKLSSYRELNSKTLQNQSEKMMQDWNRMSHTLNLPDLDQVMVGAS